MADDNTLAIAALAPQSFTLARSKTIATSLDLSRLQHAVITASGGGPDFPADQEPVQDGVACTATDGVKYYRPTLAVAQRPAGRRPGPDVWFLKDDDGVISLQWTLELVPFGPDPGGTTPLPITIGSVRMDWADGARDFDPPGLEPVPDHLPDQPAYLVRGGAKLRPDEAAQLEGAMNHPESACRLTVTYSYAYNVEVPQPVTDPPPVTDPAPTHIGGGGLGWDPGRIKAFSHLDAVGTTSLVSSAALSAAAAEPAAPAAPAVPATPFVLTRRISPGLRDLLVDGRLSAVLAGQPTRPEARTQTVTRSVPFVFEPSDEQNGPIYRSLHGAANLTEAWVHGDGGWLCESDFPNSVNRLPDDLRLAYDVDLGAPHLVPTLHRTAEGEPRVRLLARLAPYQDPRKVVLVRKLVDMPAARVVLGEVQSSTMTMGGSFPEELVVVGGGAAVVPLTGVDLTLDLSLAYYQLFCQQIASPVGIPGLVEVVLSTTPPATDGGTPTQQTTHIDVTVRLDRVDDLPCTISVPEDELSPRTVTITNTSGSDITVGGCDVTLLQVDEQSVVPVDTTPARCTTTFPVTIAAGASADVAIEPVDDPGGSGDASSTDTGNTGDTAETVDTATIWNGVLVELFDKKLVSSPADVLKRVHELAATGDVTRDLAVSSPVFSTGTLPARWSTLAGIEVEVTAADGHPTSVVLSATAPTKTIAAPITLQDVVSGAPGGISSVSYRVRNDYTDHQGAWTAPQLQSGTDLVVYPNPVEGD